MNKAWPNGVPGATAPSRRAFHAASAAGVLGLASGAANLARGRESQPDGELLYVGTYTDGDRDDGIYLVRMDPRSGALRRVGSVKAGANPSFLAIHPNGRVLYAVNEVEEHNGKPTGVVRIALPSPVCLRFIG